MASLAALAVEMEFSSLSLLVVGSSFVGGCLCTAGGTWAAFGTGRAGDARLLAGQGFSEGAG